jgi:hypothetical protein
MEVRMEIKQEVAVRSIEELAQGKVRLSFRKESETDGPGGGQVYTQEISKPEDGQNLKIGQTGTLTITLD